MAQREREVVIKIGHAYIIRWVIMPHHLQWEKGGGDACL